LGCESSQPAKTPSTPSATEEGAKRPETIVSEGCSESGRRVELLDARGEQKPDVRRVFEGGHEVCRVSDLNHDGKPDFIEYFDASGNIRRREYCYDSDGQLSAIEYYEGGKLVRREYDTTHRHRIDTWDWFDAAAPLDAKTGRPKHPTHRERDTTGNGKIDEWWSWTADRVTIAKDSNGDGKPDPASAVVFDDNGGGSIVVVDPNAPPPAPPTAGDAGASSAAAAPDGGGTSTEAPAGAAKDGGAS
jgi:hypothetical protein